MRDHCLSGQHRTSFAEIPRHERQAEVPQRLGGRLSALKDADSLIGLVYYRYLSLCKGRSRERHIASASVPGTYGSGEDLATTNAKRDDKERYL